MESKDEEMKPLLPNQAPAKAQNILHRLCTSWWSCKHEGYRRCLKSRAAILILFWNMVVLLFFQPALEPEIVESFLRSVITDFSTSYIESTGHGILLGFYGFAVFLLLFFPLGGFLADVYFGRFKTLLCSLWNLCISVIIVSCSIVLCLTVGTTAGIISITSVFIIIGGISLFVSYVLFSANVIQFGLDQLQDQPASDTSLFIYCFVWLYHLNICLWQFSSNLFICELSYRSDTDPLLWFSLLIILGFLVFCGYVFLPITLCLIRYRRFRRWFVVEPGSNNPYKLVYKVLKFAKKHDHPVQRSAFTYCEDELPSRLDLGKSKYGGPFTTEEVENVKVFGGIVRVLLTLGPIFMVELAATDSLEKFYEHLETLEFINGSEINSWSYTILKQVGIESCIFFSDGRVLSSTIIVILIPLYVCLLRPYLRCYGFGTLKRLSIAIVLFTLSLFITLTTDIVGHSKEHMYNNSICMFDTIPYAYRYPKLKNYSSSADNFLEPHYNSSSVHPLSSMNPNVVVIQITLNAFATLLFYTAAYEFICAQAPHSMKGLIIGAFFAIKGFFKFMGIVGLVIPFELWGKHIFGNKQAPWLSCGFVYYLLNIAIALVSFVAFTLVARGYHYRQRDEPSNVRQFVENYYSNIQDEPGYDYDDLDEHEVYSARPE